MPINTTLASGRLPRGGGDEKKNVDLTILATAPGGTSTDPSSGGSLAQYQAATTTGANIGRVSNVTAADFSRQGSGILSFTMPKGTFTWRARSADGSGAPWSWSGFAATGTITFAAATPVLLLVPNNGGGSYSAGGGLFFATGTSFSTVTPSNALIVLGGGGGGYTLSAPNGAPSGFYTTTASALANRRSTATEDYDGGGGFANEHTVRAYSSGLGAQHFVEGGLGGRSTGCGGANDFGGFGGGGGSCPAGGGGYAGGFAGGNTPGQYGGGGGTSYYNPAFVSNVSLETSPAARSGNYTGFVQSASGWFRIWNPVV